MSIRKRKEEIQLQYICHIYAPYWNKCLLMYFQHIIIGPFRECLLGLTREHIQGPSIHTIHYGNQVKTHFGLWTPSQKKSRPMDLLLYILHTISSSDKTNQNSKGILDQRMIKNFKLKIVALFLTWS